jgi:LCP family protein required for cell wall assembly
MDKIGGVELKFKDFAHKLKAIKISKKKLLTGVAFFMFIVLGSTAGVYIYVRSKIYEPPKDINTVMESIGDEEGEEVENTEKTEDVKYDEVDGITNILLIGVDARELNEKARSDSMIIATIDSNSKKLKLTSVMRDSYVDIYKYKTQKINAAYALGGPELLMDTIQRNLKIKLDKYIVINFWGFEDVIDILGGIDVEVKDYEISEIDKYIGEVREKKSQPITVPGMQHLDGQQALAYARIRKVGDGVYERDSRQRKVIGLLANKLKETSAIKYVSLMNKILPSIKTNIEPINFLNYAYTVSKFSPLTVQGLQIPVDELSSGQIYKDTWVLLMDKDQNSKVLNDFIFKDKLPNTKEFDMKAFNETMKAYLSKETGLKPAAKDDHIKSTDGESTSLPVAKPTPSVTPVATPVQSEAVSPTPTQTQAPTITPTPSAMPTPAATITPAANVTK